MVSIFFQQIVNIYTDISEFKKLVATEGGAKAVDVLNNIYSKFDDIIGKYESLFKVDCVSDVYLVVSGLNANFEKDNAEILDNLKSAIRAISELMDAAEEVGVKIRVGVHTGPISAVRDPSIYFILNL